MTIEVQEFEQAKAYILMSFRWWVFVTFPYNSRLNIGRMNMATRDMTAIARIGSYRRLGQDPFSYQYITDRGNIK